MKTTMEVIDIVFDVLKNSSVKDSITGKIYKISRSANSNYEDIVINTLPINNSQLQECIANVNVFVPDVEVRLNDVVHHVADEDRLLELGNIACLH